MTWRCKHGGLKDTTRCTICMDASNTGWEFIFKADTDIQTSRGETTIRNHAIAPAEEDVYKYDMYVVLKTMDKYLDFQSACG
ncbi:hypothetical protein EC973_007364 [Apophysomyces ossiformis]|uniref:Uncharacterized protein n=1 Tax=Apophysomyces ossiformis TaxID=679940 RepID=A0A8H7ER13_9FUNG|nr:hypothetical protein EC973_007364 [Apophysomyces ossiformis]